MQNENKTRYGKDSKDIARDFAEQLKYTFDSDIYHRDNQARYQAISLAIRDRIIHQWDLTRKAQRSK